MLEKKYQIAKDLRVQYFRFSKPKKEYKTLGEYKERLINHDGVWLDLDCVKDWEKIITAWLNLWKLLLHFTI